MRNNYELVELLKLRQLKIATAESITGGKLISTLIEVPGASKITEQNYIVYSNLAKINVLNVSKETIVGFGVVSKEVALDMARNLQRMTKANISVSTTGEAGPTTSSEHTKIGTVCIAIIINSKEFLFEKHFQGDRVEIINKTVTFIINELYNLIN
ncbi:MAG: CinA family protein [Tenericutes bacterium]|nr:CinA family protein [Mycoplasmatota bacterium]